MQKKDLTSVYIALLALAVIIVIFFLAYLSKMSKMPQNGSASTSPQGVMNGQQTATITILPSGTVSAPATNPTNALANKLTETQQGVQTNMTVAEDSGSVAANGRVKFKIAQFKKLALQPLVFSVFDENGKAYGPNDLQGVNGQKIHFIVVSANLHEYQHLNPTYQNGQWNVLANLPSVGTYYAYVDITPVKGNPVVLRSDLVVQQETTTAITYPGLTPNLLAITKSDTAQLAVSEALVLQQSVLSYHLTAGGKPVTLNPYLGGFGYVVIFRQGNIDSYMHIHPLSSTNAAAGLAEFMTTFVKGGRYTAFAEFMIGNSVFTFPITFDING